MSGVQLSFDAAKCCFTLEHLPLEDSYTIQSSLPQQFQVSQSTFRQSRQVLIKYMGNNLICNLVRTTPEIFICNVFFFEVSNFSFSLTVLPVYGRYMRAVMPRILRNAEGQAVKEAQEARTFRCSVRRVFCMWYMFPLLMLLVQDGSRLYLCARSIKVC